MKQFLFLIATAAFLVGCSSSTQDLTAQEKANFAGGPRPSGTEQNMANAKDSFYAQHPDLAKKYGYTPSSGQGAGR